MNYLKEFSKSVHNLPLVSIIVPSMNQANFIFETLSSVIQQDYPKIELIVIDGGSKDNSVEIIKKFQNNIHYWHSKKDNGQVDAVSYGIRISSGTLITYLNSDDILLPGCVTEVVRTWKNQREAVIFGNYFVIDEHSHVCEKKIVPLHIRWISKKLGPIMAQPGTFFTRELYDKVGGFDTKLHYAFDRDLFLRFIQQKARFLKTSKFLSAFRKHKGQKGKLDYWYQICLEDDKIIKSKYSFFNSSKSEKNIAKMFYAMIQVITFGYVYSFGYRLITQRRVKEYS